MFEKTAVVKNVAIFVFNVQMVYI